MADEQTPTGDGKKKKRRQGLTPKQRRFVREYMVDHNAAGAARRAGYSGEYADKIGSQLLGKTRVKNAVREEAEILAARTELRADQAIREAMLIAYSSLGHYWADDEAGVVRLKPDAPFGAMRALQATKVRKKRRVFPEGERLVEEFDTTVEMRLWDKVAGLRFIFQHLGLMRPPELPPLEALFAALPAEFSRGLRAYLVDQLSAGKPAAIS